MTKNADGVMKFEPGDKVTVTCFNDAQGTVVEESADNPGTYTVEFPPKKQGGEPQRVAVSVLDMVGEGEKKVKAPTPAAEPVEQGDVPAGVPVADKALAELSGLVSAVQNGQIKLTAAETKKVSGSAAGALEVLNAHQSELAQLDAEQKDVKKKELLGDWGDELRRVLGQKDVKGVPTNVTVAEKWAVNARQSVVKLMRVLAPEAYLTYRDIKYSHSPHPGLTTRQKAYKAILHGFAALAIQYGLNDETVSVTQFSMTAGRIVHDIHVMVKALDPVWYSAWFAATEADASGGVNSLSALFDKWIDMTYTVPSL